MKKHLIIIASFYLLSGLVIGILFIYGHLHFFSAYADLLTDGSVLDGNLSFLERWKHFFDVYMAYFAQFGINPLVSLLGIVSAILFGYGLLKSKEWARKLGFLLIAVNVFSSIHAVFNFGVSGSHLIQIGLSAYMWWVLTAEETKRLMKKAGNNSEA